MTFTRQHLHIQSRADARVDQLMRAMRALFTIEAERARHRRY